MATHPDPPGVDLDALLTWLDEKGLGSGPYTGVDVLTGGTQNVLVRVRRDGLDAVLRRPPLHKRRNSDETMRREARVLAALAGSAVPHPAFIAGEPDETGPLGCAFYLMAPIEGFSPGAGLPEPHRSDPAMRRAMGFSMIDAIAALGSVDHEAVGLGDFGKPEGWLERQVPRWQSQLDSYAEHDGYPGPDIPGVERVGTWLDAHRPPTWKPGLVHGDFHFNNVMVHPDRGEIAAIVDWELCTIGDPLLDLGHALATWPADPGDEVGAGGVGNGIADLPRGNELIDHYAARTGRDVSHIDWFHVLAAYKLGIILEGTHARAFAGKAPKEIGDMLHATTVGLFLRALEVIDG